ncbi:MAG: T9SS type A sorting domain-containing protein [Candidatus Cloacimonetes bacterium]|nr:T9SS type A sorting domain-containing protein [Candidatus Cloacimonadota bacterium]
MRIACTLFILLATLAATASTFSLSDFSSLAARGDRETVVLFEDGFESGLGEWETFDGTAPGNWNEAWALSVTGAWEGSSWWMHDPNTGGYTDHRYIVLDTPDITLPTGSPELSFRIAWAMEDIGGTGPYNGWDGVNVRLSDDDGDTWQVISGSPAYDVSSLYSFGEVFGEGSGVPGWSGQHDGWVSATMPLGAWSGQSVRIRFAFASDDATNSADDPDWFGVRLDDIAIDDVFLSNGDGAAGDDQMTSGYSGVTSGDFWLLDTSASHSGNASMHCPVQPSLCDELITPFIFLDFNTQPSLRYWVRPDLPDADGNANDRPDDYFEVLVKGQTEPAWTRLHWLTGQSAANWREVTPVSGGYTGDCDLSLWAGQNVQVKFVLITDDNNDGGEGAGVWLDDVALVYETSLAPPTLLAAGIVGGSVYLRWVRPNSGGGEGWIHWDDGTNYDAIGVGGSAQIDVAARFAPVDLDPFAGGTLTHIRFFPMEADCDYTLRLWTGDTPALVREQAVPAPLIGEWNEALLDSELPLTTDMTLWIGYLADTQTGYPAGCDNGPMVPGCGGWIRVDGGDWEQLTDDNPTLDYNWNIQAYITADAGLSLPPWSHGAPEREDTLSGYIISRGTSPDAINQQVHVSNDPAQSSWSDPDPLINDESFFVVRAWYNDDQQQISAPTNVNSAFLPSATMTQLLHDDGVAESEILLSAGEALAVMFTPQTPVVIRQLEVFLTATGVHLLPVRLWSDDGGLPGNVLIDFAVLPGLLHTGWNIIDLPHGVQVDGPFHAGVMGTQGNEAVGVDTSQSGAGAWFVVDWASYVQGNFMVRAWADTHLPAGDEDIPTPKLGLTSYPNPFNPETTISFALPQDGQAVLKVYNLRGQLVRTLVNSELAAGEHEIVWSGNDDNGKAVASGIYLLRLQAGGKTEVRKVLMMK